MDEKKRKTILWKLFISTLYLSAFTFGGGYVIVTLMKNKFVDEYHWIEENEMLDLVAIAQSSPGAIAVNGAIVVGYKLAGVVGIFITILGTILPPFIVLTVVSIFYNAFKSDWLISQLLEGMQAGVGAVIASVTVDMAAPIVKEKNHLSLILFFPIGGKFSQIIVASCAGRFIAVHHHAERGMIAKSSHYSFAFF